jgi:hypothetical protein
VAFKIIFWDSFCNSNQQENEILAAAISSQTTENLALIAYRDGGSVESR